MKDIIIPGSRIKAELKYLLYCYIAANLVNLYSIIRYSTEWIELITWQRFVIFIAVIFYAATILIRLIVFIFRKILSKREKAKA